MDERVPLVRPGPYGSMPPPMGSPQYAPFHPSPGYAPFPVATPAVYGGGFDGVQMIATPHAVPPPAGPPAPVPAVPVVLNEARFPDHISAVAPFAMSAKPASMCHWRPMITTVLFAGSLAWLVATVAGVDDATTQAVVLPAVAVCCTIFGFVYACEAGFADTRRYLSNILESGDATSFLDRLRNTPPRVTMVRPPPASIRRECSASFVRTCSRGPAAGASTRIAQNVVCFHMETRYSTVTESDGRGGSRTRTVPNTVRRRARPVSLPCSSSLGARRPRPPPPRQVRVDTFRESQEVPFTAWRDVSGPTAGLERFRLTKLRLEKFATWCVPRSERERRRGGGEARKKKEGAGSADKKEARAPRGT